MKLERLLETFRLLQVLQLRYRYIKQKMRASLDVIRTQDVVMVHEKEAALKAINR
jgi:hypothetical protein